MIKKATSGGRNHLVHKLEQALRSVNITTLSLEPARKPYIVNYQERRASRIYIGSGHAEKANDLIVSRRQKHKGMHWSEATADGLAALKMLMLNNGWDLYWQERRVLPLAVPA